MILSNRQVALAMLDAHETESVEAIAIGVAIVNRESRRDSEARNTAGNTPPSTDRGLWQINDHWHPEVSDGCAYNAGCATLAAAKISGGWSSWSQWATYDAGIGRPYLGLARGAIAAHKRGVTSGIVTDASRAIEVGGIDGGDISGGGLEAPIKAAGDLASSLADIARFFVGLGELLLTPEGWLRLGKLILGVAALLIATALFIQQLTGFRPRVGVAAIGRRFAAGAASR